MGSLVNIIYNFPFFIKISSKENCNISILLYGWFMSVNRGNIIHANVDVCCEVKYHKPQPGFVDDWWKKQNNLSSKLRQQFSAACVWLATVILL